MDFSHRSYEKELLDRTDIPFDAIQRNMRELNTINSLLGGHKITIAGISRLASGHAGELTICEIGCGGGDNLVAICTWCRRKNIAARFIGIDINPDCIAVATSLISDNKFQFICSDYRSVASGDQLPDIIFSSLFCHHFTEEELVAMFHWLQSNARLGFFINDLHRHAVAYYSIKMLTKLFSKSWLVKNDAPLSVRRGFTRNEWEKIFEHAAIAKYSIEWKWAFRWLIVAANIKVN